MKRKSACVFLLLAVALLGQCKKKDPHPESRLPPATQSGANTFGCLVNGEAWTPQGYTGAPNFNVSYDRSATGGVLDVRAYRIYGQGATDFQYIILFASQINGAGSYSFRSPQYTRASFDDAKSNCYWSTRDSTVTYRRGTLTITRLDLTAGVISGTFDFTLYKPGCDSIKVTKGRFDKKL